MQSNGGGVGQVDLDEAVEDGLLKVKRDWLRILLDPFFLFHSD